MKLYHFQRHSFSVSLRDREVPYYKANGVGIRLLIEGLHLNQTEMYAVSITQFSSSLQLMTSQWAGHPIALS